MFRNPKPSPCIAADPQISFPIGKIAPAKSQDLSILSDIVSRLVARRDENPLRIIALHPDLPNHIDPASDSVDAPFFLMRINRDISPIRPHVVVHSRKNPVRNHIRIRYRNIPFDEDREILGQ